MCPSRLDVCPSRPLAALTTVEASSSLRATFGRLDLTTRPTSCQKIFDPFGGLASASNINRLRRPQREPRTVENSSKTRSKTSDPFAVRGGIPAFMAGVARHAGPAPWPAIGG
ncbi:hypothetical protein Sme01_64720 [Sphaerisporangium melleum]|uniref:Uncharacterized protein n=1 Tax=Sphaerisporangium melleum TaxID=321316 RepID=A0A917VQG1_9ACTN|nr:hypothetical protein GCM10007964_52590 [Sphaerisporangium melleum]GII73996.1 hypothetical protein Sme01_64720 [Sphaerisporangium melleum]